MAKKKLNCNWCSKEIFKYVSPSRNSDHYFCSVFCRATWVGINIHAKRLSKTLKGKKRPDISAIMKGKIPASAFKKGHKSGMTGKKHSEDSKKKMSKAHKGQFSGDKHPNWQGGKSSSDYLERRRFKREVQKTVFERDNYKCTLCGNGGNLQVDHIQSWAEYVELRFSIDNCRTVCMECHYEITFGRSMPGNIKSWGHNLGRRRLKFL